jgi:translation initiation factor IF-3
LKEKNKVLNDNIRSSVVQVITESWENLWDMPIKEAKSLASEKWLDLMEIWKREGVSIVKILDYWKFLYKQKKQEQKQKQKSKAPDLKTIRITFKIWEHDLEFKKKQAEKFWEAFHPLKVTLSLRWRENQYVDIATDKITKFINSLDNYYKLEWQIKKNWNTFVAMLKPNK